MLMVLVVYAALVLALCCAWGWGVAASRVFGLRDSSIGPLWIGLAVLTALSVMLHLVVPLSAPVTAILAGAGLLFAAVRGAAEWRAGSWRGRRAEIGLIALCLIPVAWLSAGAYTLIDTALYHVQTVMWYEAYPVVPGLANLHGRFGFKAVR